MTENQGGSCEACKRKKCKCDRQLPTCGQCEVTKLSCTYGESSKRGIPTGYLGLLEQRLGETEILLYRALSELRALKTQTSFSVMHGSVHIPDPVPRNSNAPKHVRMDEWKEYPLKQEEDVERWRNFMGGGREIATGYDEPSHPEHPRYHNLPHQQFSAPDRSLAYHDTDMDFNVAAGLMGLSQSQGQNHPQGQNTNHGHAQVPTQLSTIPNPGFSSPPLPHSQKTTYPVLTSNYAADYNSSQDLQVHQEMSDPNQNPDPGQSPHSNLMHGEPSSSCGGGWQGSPPPPADAASQDTTGTQRQTELVRSQQLSAAYRNIYY